ncbi:hypothetical protein [Streptomyces sp. NPDC046197]|uniref:hypothetical protein n=1 Tax=Streptomyces sp. NPDC046197 TaxID=3154337 RepID=UPI0033E25A77
MTAHSTEKLVVRHPETGWAQARRQRGRDVRTCVPAVEGRNGSRESREEHTGSEWNIVRGED